MIHGHLVRGIAAHRPAVDPQGLARLGSHHDLHLLPGPGLVVVGHLQTRRVTVRQRVGVARRQDRRGAGGDRIDRAEVVPLGEPLVKRDRAVDVGGRAAGEVHRQGRGALDLVSHEVVQNRHPVGRGGLGRDGQVPVEEHTVVVGKGERGQHGLAPGVAGGQARAEARVAAPVLHDDHLPGIGGGRRAVAEHVAAAPGEELVVGHPAKHAAGAGADVHEADLGQEVVHGPHGGVAFVVGNAAAVGLLVDQLPALLEPQMGAEVLHRRPDFQGVVHVPGGPGIGRVPVVDVVGQARASGAVEMIGVQGPLEQRHLVAQNLVTIQRQCVHAADPDVPGETVAVRADHVPVDQVGVLVVGGVPGLGQVANKHRALQGAGGIVIALEVVPEILGAAIDSVVPGLDRHGAAPALDVGLQAVHLDLDFGQHQVLDHQDNVLAGPGARRRGQNRGRRQGHRQERCFRLSEHEAILHRLPVVSRPVPRLRGPRRSFPRSTCGPWHRRESPRPAAGRKRPRRPRRRHCRC